jgi:hypothetical protein
MNRLVEKEVFWCSHISAGKLRSVEVKNNWGIGFWGIGNKSILETVPLNVSIIS